MPGSDVTSLSRAQLEAELLDWRGGMARDVPGAVPDVEQRRKVEEERDRATAQLRALNETLEQRVAERTAELMLTEEQLRQAQKMEAVGQLTGGLAHDFNNLLTVVSGALEMIEKRLAQGRAADAGKYLVSAQSAARRAAALTQRLLAFSRRQTLNPSPTDVNRLIHGMIDLIQRTVGPEIAVQASGPADLWPALVDPSQLENALLNLCLNARDAMPFGGRITIDTANVTLGEDAARALDLAAGPYLLLRVSDTGHGMSEEVIAKAFDPFFTTKPLGQGTGLGLSMIYGFAKQSGGQVLIRSAPGEGACLCLYLPRHAGNAEADKDGAVAAESANGRPGETVLVVDDEAHVRMLVCDMLADLGYRVVEAEDGAGALAALHSSQRIDLLVSDIGLPGAMNGRQVAGAALALRPGLKVLFITGYAEDAVLEPGMAVLAKPFTVETLARRVRDMVRG
jgi:signal transduction histidine kinase